jgi:coenzyme PQQ synthesis protein D (PqqD)
MRNQICIQRIKLNPKAAASIHNDGLIVLHVPSGRIFISNQIGALIWKCLDQRLPLDAVAASISREYGIDRATAQDDAARFLAELERNGLAERGVD